MACETFTKYKNKLDNALDGTPFSGTAPTQRLYAAGLVPGKSLYNCVLVDGGEGLYIGINPADLNLAAVDLDFIFILFCNCYSACITKSPVYGLDAIWPVDGASKYKECGTSGIRTGRPPTLRDNYYYYKLVNKTIRGKIDISSAIGDANVPTITGMYALTASLQSYQSLSDISNLVINCAGENPCFSDQAIGVFESANNTYMFKRWCAKINTTTKIAYGPLKGDLYTLRNAYDAYAKMAFMQGVCYIPDKSDANESHKAVEGCPAKISCGAESMGGCTISFDPFWSTALQGYTTEGETSSTCYIKPYPLRMLDSLRGEACYTSDLFTFFVDAMAYLKSHALSCRDDTCLKNCEGRDDFDACMEDCTNAWDGDDYCGYFEYSIGCAEEALESSERRAELFDRIKTCTSSDIRLCKFQESLNRDGDIIVSQMKTKIICASSDAPNRDCWKESCCGRGVYQGNSCTGDGGVTCYDHNPEDPLGYGATRYNCGFGVVQNGCECKYADTLTAITPPIGVYTRTTKRCFKQNVYGRYNIVVKV